MPDAPRWRLLKSHYLHIAVLPDGTKVEWEQKETNRVTGRTNRKMHPVPMFLNPDDPADQSPAGSGECIVAHEVEGAFNHRHDYIFTGDPTQEMEPLNEAAEAITEACRHKWINPIDTLPVNGGMTSDEQAFMQKMMQSFAKEIGASLPQSNLAVPKDEFDKLKAELEQLKAALLAKPIEPANGRRI